MPIGSGVQWLVVIVALGASACASTGAVPRPFPMPSTASRAPDRGPARAPDPPPAAPDAPAVAPNAPALPPNAASAHQVFDAYALVGTALALRGTPYRNGGADPNGFDCSGFTQYVFAQYGLSIPREVREQFQYGNPVDSRELEPGDLVFFATTDPGASHVAIVVGGDQFIHAPSSTGVVRVEHLGSSYWSRRFLGARRISN